MLGLSVLSGLPEHLSGNPESVARIVDICGSFLTVRDEYVHLIHQSAKEYLNTSARWTGRSQSPRLLAIATGDVQDTTKGHILLALSWNLN